MTEKTCANCDAKCCKYVAAEIDVPENKEDFHHLRWFLMHENVVINVDLDKDEWFLEFKTRCKNLKENNLCKIHETKENGSKYGEPDICKEHSVEECEFYGDGAEPYDFVFTTPEQFEEFIEKNRPEIITKEPDKD